MKQIKKKRRGCRAKLREAEASGDQKRAKRLIEEIEEMNNDIERLQKDVNR